MVNNHTPKNWDKKNILDANDISEARKIYEATEEVEYHQYYNLFDVKRRNLFDWHNCDFIMKIADDLGLSKIMGIPYFLLYETNSFARTHADHETGTTVVTLIESSTDLVGGDALIFDVYGTRPRASHKEARRANCESGSNSAYEKDIIPRVVPM